MKDCAGTIFCKSVNQCYFCKSVNQCYFCKSVNQCYFCKSVNQCYFCKSVKQCYFCKSVNQCYFCKNILSKQEGSLLLTKEYINNLKFKLNKSFNFYEKSKKTKFHK